jgi:hypothetical protein
MRSIHCTGIAAALPAIAITLSGCVSQGAQVPISTFGVWPPQNTACVRHDQIDNTAIWNELTRLHKDPACVAQITVCTWSDGQDRSIERDVTGAILWEGPASHLFSIADQNDIIARARAQAKALRPAGLTWNSLEFWPNTVVTSSGTTTDLQLAAIAGYAKCTRIPGSVLPPDWQRMPKPTGTEHLSN